MQGLKAAEVEMSSVWVNLTNTSFSFNNATCVIHYLAGKCPHLSNNNTGCL